jgi:hypothetical protein
MGVSGEALEQRRGLKRRPLAATITLAGAALVAYLYMPIPAPNVAPPSAGDCVELHMWSNGFHSDIGAPAAIFPADHPLRRLYPDAESFLIGWGEQAFYFSDGTDLMLGLDALVPPSPSVLHVAYNAGPSSAYLGPNDDTAIAVSATARRGSSLYRRGAGARRGGRARGHVAGQGGRPLGVPAHARLVPPVQRLQSMDGPRAAGRRHRRQRPRRLDGRAADRPGAQDRADGVSGLTPQPSRAI